MFYTLHFVKKIKNVNLLIVEALYLNLHNRKFNYHMNEIFCSNTKN